MGEHLVFTLEAPFASWGEIAVGEMRPSADRPTRSCLIGLIAACCGIRRDSEDALEALEGLCVAYRVDDPGLPMHDYQTIQVPRAEKAVRYRTRKDEVSWRRRSDLETILSSRVYRMEVRATAVLNRSPTASEACPSLVEIARAMDQPAFIPYLGRRSCPLAMPLRPFLVTAPDFVTAWKLGIENERSRESQDGFGGAAELKVDSRWFWEDGCYTPFPAQRSHSRYDRCTSRARRLFAERLEHEAIVSSDA